MMYRLFVSLGVFFLVTAATAPVYAQQVHPEGESSLTDSQVPMPDQTSGAPAPEEVMLQAVEDKMRVELEKLSEFDPTLPSLFFTQKEYTALRAAVGGFERNLDVGGTENEDMGDLLSALPNQSEKIQTVRDIELGGIVYFSENDWIIWVNNERLTPKRISPQIKDIKVNKSFVDLRWFDPKTRKIIPIRLRPNQRFNLDALMFLPG